jgi:hypothetical protein
VTGSAGAGHRVVLVRSWDEGRAGGGCCGGIDGATVSGRPHDHRSDPDPPAGTASSAATYCSLRERFPGLEVTVVDSGNWAWLGPAVYRDARRSGRGRLASLREAARATTPGCLVVDGEVVLDGRPPTPTEAVAEVVGRSPVTTSTG